MDDKPRREDPLDELLSESLAFDDEDATRRARSATVRAFNRIESERRADTAPAPRRSRQRLVILTAGWILSLALVIRAISWLATGTGPRVAALFELPLVQSAAAALSLTPLYLIAGSLLLLAALVFTLSQVLARD